MAQRSNCGFAFLLIAICCVKLASGIAGWGCTDATSIDKDCDGYGVASDLGPDANDNDPTVNTYASFQTKYSGDLKAYFNDLGYTFVADIYYISTTGSDSTGA